MKNDYIIQFEICLADSEKDNGKVINEWLNAIEDFNYNTLRVNNPHHNPIITNVKTMKSVI